MFDQQIDPAVAEISTRDTMPYGQFAGEVLEAIPSI